MASDRFAPLVAETAVLAEAFRSAGKTLYLVGGIVRDTLLQRGHAELDIDLTTDALPDDIELIVRQCRPTALWTQGKRFGTIGVSVPGPHGPRSVEITTHRAEQYSDSSRKPEVRFSSDLTLDLSRRDFTVNAMAYDLHRLALLDPFGGQGDLTDRRLRTPLSPEISFRDDPLRMLRAARFMSGLRLVPDPALIDAVVALGHRMSIVSSERIHGELAKLLTLEDPADGVRFLASTSLVSVFLPELDVATVERTIARVVRVASEWPLRFAALVWDTFATERDASARLRILKCSLDEQAFITTLLRLKRHDLASASASDASARRFVLQAGTRRDAFLTVAGADASVRLAEGDVDAARSDAELRALQRRLDALSRSEDLADLGPELDGRHVMNVLALQPGRAVGEALAMLQELRLDEGVVGEDEADRRLRRWWEHRNATASGGRAVNGASAAADAEPGRN